MNPKQLAKKVLSKAFLKLLPRYAHDVRYRSQMARALAPCLRSYAETDDYFDLWQEHGFHLVRNHFFQPIPDTRQLPESLWGERRTCDQIDFREAAQVQLLRDGLAPYMGECQFPDRPTADPHQFHLGAGSFEAVDAEVLHCFIRHFKPRRVVEIGGGSSTLISARACRLNAEDGTETRLRTIEPYPNDVLRAGVPGLDELVVARLEDVQPQTFDELGDGDILFVDSSHTVRIGGDVNHIFFTILPRLNDGVIVHFHDIYLPEEYLRRYIHDRHWFWTEQYLLRAFLMHNQDYHVLWAGSYMRLTHPQELASVFRSYRPGETVPGSFWIRKGRAGGSA